MPVCRSLLCAYNLFFLNLFKVRDLRGLIATNGRLPKDNLSLVLRGAALSDTKNGDDVHVKLNDGGKVLSLHLFLSIWYLTFT